MESTRPLASVVVVCYNQSRFVVECLDSIRHQSYENIQLIIMDDCSQDNSIAVIQGWLDDRCVEATFVAHTQNMGICKTFNEAISHATGKYISIVAADDVYMPNKIELQVKLLEKLPLTVGVVYSDALQMDSNGNLLTQKFIEVHRQFESAPEGQIFPVLLRGNFIPAMTTLVRRQCYETVGLYDETLCYEDFDMWLRISQQYSFIYSPIISAKYRIVPTSRVHTVNIKNGWDMLRSNFRIYEKCLTTNGINNEQRSFVEFRLTAIAKQMYAGKWKGRNYYLFKLSKYYPRAHTVGLLFFSVAEIPYAYLSRIVWWYRSLKERLRSTT